MAVPETAVFGDTFPDRPLSVFVSWVLFPLVLAVLALGVGCCSSRSRHWLLPGPLVVPAGIAVMIVAAQLHHGDGRDGRADVPLVVFLAVAGACASSFPRGRDGGPDPWAIAAALGVFAVFALPTAARAQRDVRRLHQARRHRDLVRPDRPGDGARPQPRRAGALLLRGHARLQPRERLPDRRLPAARGRRGRSSARTSPGSSSPTSPSSPRCCRSASTRWPARWCGRAPLRCARRVRRAARPRCCSATRCGAG